MDLRSHFWKSWLGLLLGDYAIYKIFSFELDAVPAIVQPEPHLEIRALEDAPDSLVLGAFVDGERACACWIWSGERYRRERNFWPLERTEAKLAHIETHPKFRGQGLAGVVLQHASTEMKRRGFVRLYARIWHNNLPSIRTFTKAGWKYERFVLFLQPFHIGKHFRLSFRGKR